MAFQRVMSLSAMAESEPQKISVDGTDIVLVKLGDKVFALEAACPHSGAPLEKGAVCQGKLICPWHKSVFSLDGTLEDPPALRSLKRYPVNIEGNAVWIDPSPMAQPGVPSIAVESDTEALVVVGAGAGGSAAVKALRDKGYAGRLIVIDREKQAPYDRTALSKFVPQGDMALDEVPALLETRFYREEHIERITGDVEALCVKERKLRLADGGIIPYRRLLLATGGTPRRPDLPGKALLGVEVLRSWEHAAALMSAVEKRHRLVIIGNSFIGMEMAAALRKRNVDITVVAKRPLPFEQQFGTVLATFFRRRHEDRGVKFVDGEPASFDGEQRVTGVILKDGRRVDGDLVLLATGVAPSTGFIHDLPLNDDGSLSVDSAMSAGQDVYAIGDIATFALNGRPTRIEHWRVAQQQGRIAAAAMIGGNDAYHAIPYFWTQHYGVRYEYLGHATDWDDIDIFGSPDKDDFVALFSRDERLAAVVAAGRMRTTGTLLVRMGEPLTLREARRIVNEVAEPGK
ncbi:FAD-dependent oxidoreductase [Martelella alba]|uniref:Rieske 2Fe-2S domain-containing protein n=1 Tax=Martelella alba TaxID=2590451 RepID=A0ABY2SMH7_9HYPH|nr:FAD-dependent oxidoreductase [Martelella alba]TKI06328.1 Rieske 2Fe-2S domain-containing protein [Martelella alba]